MVTQNGLKGTHGDEFTTTENNPDDVIKDELIMWTDVLSQCQPLPMPIIRFLLA